MALHIDDITVTKAQGWVEIPLLTGGTFVEIEQIVGGIINARVGATSTSMGIAMQGRDKLLNITESIFVKNNQGRDIIVTVIRDATV